MLLLNFIYIVIKYVQNNKDHKRIIYNHNVQYIHTCTLHISKIITTALTKTSKSISKQHAGFPDTTTHHHKNRL